VRRRLTSVAGLSLVMALTALAGCGGSSSGNGVASKSPPEIIAAARAAADGASTVHVSGSTVTSGTPIALDLSLVAQVRGHGCGLAARILDPVRHAIESFAVAGGQDYVSTGRRHGRGGGRPDPAAGPGNDRQPSR